MLSLKCNTIVSMLVNMTCSYRLSDSTNVRLNVVKRPYYFVCRIDSYCVKACVYSEGPAAGHLNSGFSAFLLSLSKC
jgi:hypothetical protein